MTDPNPTEKSTPLSRFLSVVGWTKKQFKDACLSVFYCILMLASLPEYFSPFMIILGPFAITLSAIVGHSYLEGLRENRKSVFRDLGIENPPSDAQLYYQSVYWALFSALFFSSVTYNLPGMKQVTGYFSPVVFGSMLGYYAGPLLLALVKVMLKAFVSWLGSRGGFEEKWKIADNLLHSNTSASSFHITSSNEFQTEPPPNKSARQIASSAGSWMLSGALSLGAKLSKLVRSDAKPVESSGQSEYDPHSGKNL